MNQSIASLLRSAMNATAGPRLRRNSQLLSLEQRFMFDGAAVADAAHAAQTPDAAATAAPALPPAVTVREAEPAKDNGKKEVVLVDTSLANYKALEAGVRDGVGIVEFDCSKDGLAQIAQWASTQSGLDAIHILSHGSEGVLNLGTAHITEASLSDASTKAELAQLGQALGSEGDLLLYGCDTGDSAALLNGLAQATGADVAASTDLTGAAKQGGDWVLEAHSGAIEAQALSLPDYNGVLQTVSFVNGQDGDDNGADIDGNGQVNSINKVVGGTPIRFESGGPELYVYSDGSGLYSMSADQNSIYLKVTIQNGSSFNLSNVQVASFVSSMNIALTRADGTTDNVTVNLGPADGLLHPITLNLQNVTSLIFTAANYTTFQDFGITLFAPPTVASATLSADTAANGTTNTDFVTKTAAQTISGTLSGNLSTGERVQVSFDNGANWADASTYSVGSNTWSTSTTLAGSNTFQARVIAANGDPTTPYTHTYTLDTTPPTISFSNVTFSADRGSSSNDLVTNLSGQTIQATLSAVPGGTDTVWASTDNGTTWSNVTSKVSGTTLTWTGATLVSTNSTLRFRVTDLAGNDSVTSIQAYTLDTSAPATTAVAVPPSATYHTGDNLDFTVNFGEAVTVDSSGGTPRIALTVGATTRFATYVSGSGTSALVFRYTVVNGDSDANGISVGALSANGGTLRDTAGNDASTTLNSVASTAGVNVDGSNPSVTNVAASTLDGSYGAGQTVTITVDFSSAVTVDTTNGSPTLALSDGGIATYSGGSGGATLTFTYVVAAGQNSSDLDYSATTALALNGATIIEAGGSHQNASVTLATPGTAGSLSANKDLIIDTTAPTNTVNTAKFSADTGTSGTDFITKTAAQTISGTLTSNLAAGENVYVSLDNGSSWTLATISVGSKNWSLAGQTLTGSSTLRVRVSDDAGNNGGALAQAYVLDTTNPTTTFSGISFSADNGASDSDLITNVAAQTISATLSNAPGAGDIVYGSLDNGATWADITSKVSGTTLTWTGVTLAGSDTLRFRVTDAAGNNGNASAAAYVLDTTGSNTSVASVNFSADSGTSQSDFITRNSGQNISGTLSANLAAGESVLVSLDNGATWATASTTVGSSSWLLNGQTLVSSDTLQVKVVDIAGNDGPVLSQSYIYDTAATVPTVDPLTTPSVTPVLTGNASLAAGETLTITVGGATYDVTPVAGAWSLDLATAVPVSGALTLTLNQQYSVTATVIDLAGNSASDTSTGELIVGTLVPPTVPTAPTEGFQTPPVRPEPLPPMVQPPSFLPPSASEPVARLPPAFDTGAGNPWQSPTLFGDALSGSAEIDGGMAELMSPGAGLMFMGGRDGVGSRAPLTDLVVQSGERVSLQVNAESFMQSQPGQTVRLTAELADGRPLPSWLKFNSRDGRFEGKAPADFSGKLTVRVIARDGLGHEAIQEFDIVIARPDQAQTALPAAAELGGRSSLTQQLRDARSHGANRLAGLAAAADGRRT